MAMTHIIQLIAFNFLITLFFLKLKFFQISISNATFYSAQFDFKGKVSHRLTKTFDLVCSSIQISPTASKILQKQDGFPPTKCVYILILIENLDNVSLFLSCSIR